ncbi:hypothetical protein BDB00DRAFT_296506 [Zychaea mexicana]|uniref:uncharacterized protein n=1 Tax=Zychaea mexicana TaxID=64656 RepID=UPI0022FE9201|nr:uncharacterized protein BDB00DRAFT_296506 [Zychaea mexicana]KAI9494611.1 hypothetical protein BDB00DRAFT_296506 [Zychaea mexicana]
MTYSDERLEPSPYAIIRWFGFDKFIPEAAVTSHWVSSNVFLCIRSIVALYSTIVIWTNIGSSARDGTIQSFFAFFTTLTFIGLHAYLVTAVYHHVRYILAKRQLVSFFNQPAVLNYLYYYLYHTILVFNIITPVVYWALLADVQGQGSNALGVWLNVSVHGVSFFMMMSEMIFCRIKMQMNIVLLIVIHVILYMFLSFIVHASAGFWVYPFLDWDQGPVAAGLYIGVGACFVVVFFLQMLFHLIRDWIAKITGRGTVAVKHEQQRELEQPEMAERRDIEEA